ncbi:acyl-CoA N-acyltransferase [Cristinia sonorae]|uniref:Acyl-CoA N-acyltransferase n=1 Tax=Cristinia sonorae TaxID=1940300 RepID=A0A8K0UJB9_9AGAR|nr:acyl-CoA N-acyltransferase [Cristinia sonorae]
MRANKDTTIRLANIVLVPYRKEHVAKYHEWMQSAELQELTASEPLTLEEEYEMQQKWQDDEDKLTFIICVQSDLGNDGTDTVTTPTGNGSLVMVGDVNLFLKGSPDDEDFEVEAEIMIAEQQYRRQGIAHKALQLMLSYATSPASPSPLPINPASLVVRIGESNGSSIRLFEKLGFVLTKRVEVFHEVELRFRGNPEEWVKGTVAQISPSLFVS